MTRSGKASPLHRAAHCGHSDIVKILIDYGAKLELHDSDGQTALHKVKINIICFMLNIKNIFTFLNRVQIFTHFLVRPHTSL